MNWVTLDIEDKKTFPLFEIPEKMTIIFALEDKFVLGTIKEGTDGLMVDDGHTTYPLSQVKAWSYVMPVENKFKNIQEFIDNREISFERKATSFSEAKDYQIDIYEYIYLCSVLIIYESEELLEDDRVDSNFTMDCDQFLLIKNNGELYLVDTQGYGYARYIVKIVLGEKDASINS